MKFIKQLFLVLGLTFLTSCGFSPMLKNPKIDNIKINKIEYSGDKDLVFFLRNSLNLKTNNNIKDGYILEIKITESIASSKKNSAGVTISENITITINLNIYDASNNLINNDIISETRLIDVTNNIISDNETRRVERSNLISFLIQELKFSIKSKIIQNLK